MNPKQEFDNAGHAVAKAVRAARQRVQQLETVGIPKEDPDALERAKSDLKDVLKLEEALAEASEALTKRAEKHAEHVAKEAEKAAKEAEKATEKAEHKVVIMEHKAEEHPHHAPVHKK